MNEPIADRPGRFAPFYQSMRGEPEPGTVEQWAWADGTVALAIGCASFAACLIAAVVIALAYEIGRFS